MYKTNHTGMLGYLDHLRSDAQQLTHEQVQDYYARLEQTLNTLQHASHKKTLPKQPPRQLSGKG
ncbi:MAG: hypothetical protein H0W44_09470 [Gammaproteobacteria bacterium]|nr:hypothetical protein [Gammaproteobacteria bacterium]